MHIYVRMLGKPDTIVVVESKLTKIEIFRKIIEEKLGIDPKLQRLFYGGKLLEDGYNFHDYNIKLNDVIQLLVSQTNGEVTQGPLSEKNSKKKIKKDEEVIYEDAKSTLYEIGDLLDVRDVDMGAWEEGKLVRIVVNPDVTTVPDSQNENGLDDNKNKTNYSDVPDTPNTSNVDTLETTPKEIAKYFIKSNDKMPPTNEPPAIESQVPDKDLLYKVKLDSDDAETLYYQLKDIRPRARTALDVEYLKVGQTIMINHNLEHPQEKGHWYDFKVNKISKVRKGLNLHGTLYTGTESVPQNDTTIIVHDKVFMIEDAVPLDERTEEYKKIISVVPEKRSEPLRCVTCRDDVDMPCEDCGCCLCLGKNEPENILLCDECNKGYHTMCLTPPVTEIPDDDWYCPSCKRDPNVVVAPGAAKQAKKTHTSGSKRDWGRGMACMGKTKTCAMPPNHFGPIPGIEVGMCWRFRIQLSESGVHRPPVSGIHGRDVEGAYSLVLSGGYEDDVDHGNEFTYTGSGGRDLSGNKRTAEQSCDQTLTRENKALARNCAVALNEKGGDAGDDWRNGKPVRVVRSFKMLKHFPQYAPKGGIRYDGIYKVVKYYPAKGLSGYRVWKYLLRRDDPSPAPWEKGAKQFAIIYPDGYLEAEAEKKALKEKKSTAPRGKRALQTKSSSDDELQPKKKQKTIDNNKIKRKSETSPNKSSTSKHRSNLPKVQSEDAQSIDQVLTPEELSAIKADTLNVKQWEECLQTCETITKQDFIERVTKVFLCIICQEVAVNPITTSCLHNFCKSCIKLAVKTTESNACPCCRKNLADEDLQLNENLRTALRAILAGYDAGKK